MRDSEIPEFVYKVFSEEEHASSFLNEGRFRIGKLQTYKSIEDAGRKDKLEGQASYQFEDDLIQVHYSEEFEATGTSTKRGLMHVSGSLGNPTYIFCTSRPTADVEYLEQRFGSYMIRINDPKHFIDDLREALEKTEYRFLNKSHIAKRNVEYSKGQVIEADLETVASCELAVYQKPPEFEPEQEFRFIALMSHLDPPSPEPDYVEIDFGKKIDYASMC